MSYFQSLRVNTFYDCTLKIIKDPLFQSFLTISNKSFTANRFLIVSNKCMENFNSIYEIAFERLKEKAVRRCELSF